MARPVVLNYTRACSTKVMHEVVICLLKPQLKIKTQRDTQMPTWVDTLPYLYKLRLSVIHVHTQQYCTHVHLPRHNAYTHTYRVLHVHMLNGIFISMHRVTLSECNALIFSVFVLYGCDKSKVLLNDQKQSLKSS